MRALVLGGGSIKGCYQAGAISALLASPRSYQPGFVSGISVGALNGAFLVDRAGRAWKSGRAPDWPAIGTELAQFWRENVRSFSDLGKKRGWLSLLWDIGTDQFDGLTSMDALETLVRREIDAENLRIADAQGLRFEAGTVNLRDGAYLAAEPSNPRVLELILASAASPIVMPARRIDSGVWLDGGVRNVTPLKSAIDAGANTIVCVVCQQHGLLPDPAFEPGRLMPLADQISEVVEQTILDGDLLVAAKKNRLVAEFGNTEVVATKRWRELDIRVIRPSAPLEIDLEDFTSADIERGIAQGFADATSP